MHGTIRCLMLLVAFQLLAGLLSGQEKQVEPKPVSKLVSPAATIDDIKWIAGHWQGSAMGGEFEETWNPPFAGTMVGMFKFAKKGEVDFYELLTIVEKEGSLLLRLKHFGKDLKGWEEKDKSVEFPLQSLSDTKAAFKGLVFQKIDESTMHILVTVKQNEGAAEEIKFVCKRRKDHE